MKKLWPITRHWGIVGAFLVCMPPAVAQAQGQQIAQCSAEIETREPQLLWDGAPPGMSTWGGILDVPVSEGSTPDGNNLFNVGPGGNWGLFTRRINSKKARRSGADC